MNILPCTTYHGHNLTKNRLHDLFVLLRFNLATFPFHLLAISSPFLGFVLPRSLDASTALESFPYMVDLHLFLYLLDSFLYLLGFDQTWTGF